MEGCKVTSGFLSQGQSRTSIWIPDLNLVKKRTWNRIRNTYWKKARLDYKLSCLLSMESSEAFLGSPNFRWYPDFVYFKLPHPASAQHGPDPPVIGVFCYWRLLWFGARCDWCLWKGLRMRDTSLGATRTIAIEKIPQAFCTRESIRYLGALPAYNMTLDPDPHRVGFPVSQSGST